MSADLERLLQDAAAAPRRDLDLDLLEATARRRRARRRATGALAVLAVLVATAAALPGLVRPRVLVDSPAETDRWPVLARYTETRHDEGRAYEWQVGARGWASWTMVRARSFNLDETGEPVEPSPDGLALARAGEGRWSGTTSAPDADGREALFALVEAALAGQWAERHVVEETPEAQAGWEPLTGFGPDPATSDDVPADRLTAPDLPGLRAEVAARLGLDAGALVAFSAERDDGVHVTWVRDAASGLPLLYEEAAGATQEGADAGPGRVTLTVTATEVRFGAELPEPPQPSPDPDVEETAEPEVGPAGEWRRLPDAPVDGRQGAGAVWTGEELLVWGGVPRAGGAAYDPDADSWRVLPDAPIDAREWHVAAWTGDELVVWGGSAYEEPDDPDAPMQQDVGELRADGAAYDPEADSWRPLADSPLAPRAGAAAVWTGSEVVIVSGTGAGLDPGTTHDFIDGAAYDPAGDAWRAIPDLPDDGLREIGSSAAWTGSEMLVGGSRFAPGLAAAYDPAADAWRLVEDSPLAGAGGFVASTGAEAILTDAQLGGLAAYDPAADAWRELSPPPADLNAIAFADADDRLLALGGLNAADGPMGAWRFDPAGETWTPLDDAPIADRGNPVAVWTGEELLVWSGTAVAVGDERAAHHDGAAWRPR